MNVHSTLLLFWIIILWSCLFMEARMMTYFDETWEEMSNNFESRIPEFPIDFTSNPSANKFERTPTFNVVQYGAIGDGRTDDSQAFLRAWRDACEVAGRMARVVVPSRVFLLKPILFNGPCKASKIHLEINGRIVAPNMNAWYEDKEQWIKFEDVKGLIIDGRGIIDGQGEQWWKQCQYSELFYPLQLDQSCPRPTALSFHKCNDLQLSHLKHINSQKNHISISGCTGVDISNIHIAAPKDSPNTDGIDITSSSHIRIRNSDIATGDDCVAINGFVSSINITGILCGPGHGISVGSLGKGGTYETVEDVHVRNCTFTRTQNGVRIKTWKGGRGYARRISFEHIKFIDSHNPIIINQNYKSGYVYEDRDLSDVHISDITYRNILGSSADEIAIDLNCGRNIGCSNIVMDNVNIISDSPGKQVSAFCNNAHGSTHSAFPVVPCLSKKVT